MKSHRPNGSRGTANLTRRPNDSKVYMTCWICRQPIQPISPYGGICAARIFTWTSTENTWSIMGGVIDEACQSVATLRSRQSTKWSACGVRRSVKCDGPIKAHLLVQVRVAVLNGELKMREKPIPRRFPTKDKYGDQVEHAA